MDDCLGDAADAFVGACHRTTSGNPLLLRQLLRALESEDVPPRRVAHRHRPSALAPWIGGHRMPNFTFEGGELVDAYDERTLSRLRRAIRTYDPDGVIAIGHALAA